MTEPLCTLCAANLAHDHADGRVPLLPCWPCFNGDHDNCDPGQHRFWCGCLVLECLLKGVP